MKNKNKLSTIEALSEAQKLAFAPLTFQAVNSLLKLGVLKYLDKTPSSLNELINSLNLTEYTLKTLLDIALLTNIVELNENKYLLTKKGLAFLYDEMTIANFNFVNDVCYLGASELTDSFLNKKPEGLNKFIKKSDTIYPLLTELPDKIKKSWYEFDHLYSDNCFDEVFKIISGEYKKIFDIGGNTGKFEKVCLKSNKNIDITMLDLKENIDFAKDNKELTGCKFHKVNVLDSNPSYPSFFDSAILMSQFLDCFSKGQIKKILGDLSKKMNQNSKIYILEPFTDNQNFEAAKYSLSHISLYFTCMANGVSKMYEQDEMLDLIKDSDLKPVKIHNNLGPFDYTLIEVQKDAMV